MMANDVQGSGRGQGVKCKRIGELNYIIKHRAMRSGGMGPPFLTLALDIGEWSASCPGRFSLGETALGTPWIGGWVGSESVWTLWKGEKSLVTAGNRNPTMQPIA
jgi:hypothetical protein